MVNRARLADDVVGAVIGVAVKNKEDFEGALVPSSNMSVIHRSNVGEVYALFASLVAAV